MLRELKLRSRHYLLVYIIISCVLFVIYYNISFKHGKEFSYKIEIIHWPKLKSNLCCHYAIEDDALPSVEDTNFSPGVKSIFFHEMSCRGGINSRQACAVESAARLHPNWDIYLLFSAPVTEIILQKSCLAKLRQFANVKFARVHVREYTKGTVLEEIVANQLWKSTYPIEHAADILRILTLHKYGGVYLDTDSILIRNIDALPANWIAKETDNRVGSGAMAFTKDGVGANLTRDVMIELHDTFAPRSWNGNGPRAINRVLSRVCPDMLLIGGNCDGTEIYPSELFYPVPYHFNSIYFKNGDIDSIAGPYMHHMWNYVSSDLKIEKYSPYATLARKCCPTIYKMYGDQFGE